MRSDPYNVNKPIARRGMADGGSHQGLVRGPGGPTDDKVPAMYSNGEYVLPADTTAAIGVDNLDAVREATHVPAGGNGRIQRRAPLKMADGGGKFEKARKAAVKAAAYAKQTAQRATEAAKPYFAKPPVPARYTPAAPQPAAAPTVSTSVEDGFTTKGTGQEPQPYEAPVEKPGWLRRTAGRLGRVGRAFGEPLAAVAPGIEALHTVGDSEATKDAFASRYGINTSTDMGRDRANMLRATMGAVDALPSAPGALSNAVLGTHFPTDVVSRTAAGLDKWSKGVREGQGFGNSGFSDTWNAPTADDAYKTQVDRNDQNAATRQALADNKAGITGRGSNPSIAASQESFFGKGVNALPSDQPLPTARGQAVFNNVTGGAGATPSTPAMVPGMKTLDGRVGGYASSVNAQGNNVYDNDSIKRFSAAAAGPSHGVVAGTGDGQSAARIIGDYDRFHNSLTPDNTPEKIRTYNTQTGGSDISRPIGARSTSISTGYRTDDPAKRQVFADGGMSRKGRMHFEDGGMGSDDDGVSRRMYVGRMYAEGGHSPNDDIEMQVAKSKEALTAQYVNLANQYKIDPPPQVVASPDTTNAAIGATRRALGEVNAATNMTRGDATNILNPMSDDAELARRADIESHSYSNRGSPAGRARAYGVYEDALATRNAANVANQNHVAAIAGAGAEGATAAAASGASRRDTANIQNSGNTLDAAKYNSEFGKALASGMLHFIQTPQQLFENKILQQKASQDADMFAINRDTARDKGAQDFEAQYLKEHPGTPDSEVAAARLQQELQGNIGGLSPSALDTLNKANEASRASANTNTGFVNDALHGDWHAPFINPQINPTSNVDMAQAEITPAGGIMGMIDRARGAPKYRVQYTNQDKPGEAQPHYYTDAAGAASLGNIQRAIARRSPNK